MATHKSSAKRARQTIKKTNRNRSHESSVKTAVKKFRAAVESKDKKEVLATLLSAAQSKIAKAAKRGLYHGNTASRKISRLTALIAKKK